MEALIDKVYHSLSSPAAYAGGRRVYEEAHRRDKRITLNDVRRYLQNERIYTMHKAARRKFPRLANRAAGLHTNWQADLAIFDAIADKNDGYKYLLVCIDLFSRKLFVAPTKSKSSSDMIDAFEHIFKQSKGILPNILHTDRGVEFQAKAMREYFYKKDIDKRVVYNPDVHAAVVERANRTIKERLYRYFSEHNTTRWLEAIKRIVAGINASTTRATGQTPDSVTFKNAPKLRKKLYKLERERLENIPDSRRILKIGQIVRVAKKQGKFDKPSSFPNYTDQLFRVKLLSGTKPIVYKLENLRAEELPGTFYREQLVETSHDKTTHRIAEIIKTRIRGGRKQHLVRWVGYDSRFNSYIDDQDILRNTDD